MRNVKWTERAINKRVAFLAFSHRLSMVDSGSLMISEVQASDAGKYECSAQSMAGSKEAPPAMLKVLAPPTIVRGPQDTEVIEGDGLDLPCEVSLIKVMRHLHAQFAYIRIVLYIPYTKLFNVHGHLPHKLIYKQNIYYGITLQYSN